MEIDLIILSIDMNQTPVASGNSLLFFKSTISDEENVTDHQSYNLLKMLQSVTNMQTILVRTR